MTAYLEKYGNWAGEPQGHAPNFSLCCEKVYHEHLRRFFQCSRKRGHGPDGEYCRTHNPQNVAARKKASSEKYAREMKLKRIEWAGPKFLAMLRLIAEGHNDARGLAAEAIKDFPREDSNV
jgi:hypothetical protein